MILIVLIFFGGVLTILSPCILPVVTVAGIASGAGARHEW
jgi:cytochrome c biogenesis protein CcdA